MTCHDWTIFGVIWVDQNDPNIFVPLTKYRSVPNRIEITILDSFYIHNIPLLAFFIGHILEYMAIYDLIKLKKFSN